MGKSNLIPFELLIGLIVFVVSLFILSDILLLVMGKFWEKFSLEIFDSNKNLENFAEFSPSEQNFPEVIKDTKIKFEDVAGNEEAKAELQEVVEFLKDAKDFRKLGAMVPKGVLLSGPPGTGKTLFAKAIAGEAGTPFIKVSGSQFVEVLVGVGAARIRELFEKAKSMAPCIIFIDEIDSLARGRSSNNNMGGGNDEREQTLNQILTEMDGFKSNTGVLVIGATNRLDILDSAITRPGRFDRQISINIPNLNERKAILKVHAKGKKLANSVSLSQIAQRTIGFSGADLANLLNEAAILAARKKKDFISMEEINSSIDRIILGLENKALSRVKSRQLVAFYEMGRAFVASLLNENVQKITLLPRGKNQSTTVQLSSKNRFPSRQFFLNKVLISLSGRVIEDVICGTLEISVGAQKDLLQMTRSFRTIITRYAMLRLQELKQTSQKRNLFFLGNDIKEELNNTVDNFTTNFFDIFYNELILFFKFFRTGGERLVDDLLIFEEVSGNSLKNIIREYFSQKKSLEAFLTNKDSSIFNLLIKELQKEAVELDDQIKIQKEKLEKILKKKKLSKKSKK